jgi:hypothetical protein
MQGHPIERLELGEGPLVCRVRLRKQMLVYAHVIVGEVVLHHEGMVLANPCARRRMWTCGKASAWVGFVSIGSRCYPATCGCESWRQPVQA